MWAVGCEMWVVGRGMWNVEGGRWKVEGREKTLRRRIWLIATVTAFFVLQAPLCALACFESLDVTGASADAAPISASPSCHDEQSPDSSASGEPSSPLDCGCDFALQVVISHASDLDITQAPVFAISPRSQKLVFAAAVSELPAVFYGSDLPPPDILLLKSTLLL